MGMDENDDEGDGMTADGFGSDACRVTFHFENTTDVVVADMERSLLYGMLDQTEDAMRPDVTDDGEEPPSVGTTIYHMVHAADDPSREVIIDMTHVTYIEVVPRRV